MGEQSLSYPSSSDPELRWVRAPDASAFTQFTHPETMKEKMYRKTTANPLVPIGVLLTTAALTVGIYTMKTGNKQMGQYMMRARVAAQAFTVIALVGGVVAIGARAK